MQTEKIEGEYRLSNGNGSVEIAKEHVDSLVALAVTFFGAGDVMGCDRRRAEQDSEGSPWSLEGEQMLVYRPEGREEQRLQLDINDLNELSMQ